MARRNRDGACLQSARLGTADMLGRDKAPEAPPAVVSRFLAGCILAGAALVVLGLILLVL